MDHTSPYVGADEASIRQAIAGYQGPDWDGYDLTPEQADSEVVKYRGKHHTLGWLAAKHPEHLDELLDRVEPGTRLFFALVIVCEKNEDAIARADMRRGRHYRETNRGNRRKVSVPRVVLDPKTLAALRRRIEAGDGTDEGRNRGMDRSGVRVPTGQGRVLVRGG